MSVDDIVRDITGSMINDGSVDYIQMYEKLDLINTIGSLILGLMVYIIIIGVPLIVSLELLYINFPIMQTSYEKVLVRTTGHLNNVLGFVMHDAKIAVREANTINTGRDANWIYLRIKCKAIFLAVLCVTLVLGAGPLVVDIIVKIANAFIKGFNELF